jgi:hypothetical protein
MMIEAASTSETSINYYQTTRRNNPEDSHHHARRRENLKSHGSLECLMDVNLKWGTASAYINCTKTATPNRSEYNTQHEFV